MVDGKHCTFPYLPNKTFVYNAAEDRLELCVDAAGHFPIGPEVEELVKEALTQVRSEASSRSRESSPSHGLMKLGSGGVVKKKSEQHHNVTVFQGKGHSLGTASSSPEHNQRTRATTKPSPTASLHSTASDSDSSSLMSTSNDSELIRVAPGVVTMRDGRQLDPNLIEAQRKKLQEMVSSIQASMDKHLRDQNAEPVSGSDTSPKKGEWLSSKPMGSPSRGNVDTTVGPVAPAGNVGSSIATSLSVRPKVQSSVSTDDAEEMDSQDTEIAHIAEPMDHS